MPHMVVFRTKEGKQGYHLADSLDDAVRFVEHLRNNEQVADSKVYRMHEVPIEFKVMYKVEVAGTGGASASPSDDTASTESGRSTETASPSAGGASVSGSRAEDRNDAVRAQSSTGLGGGVGQAGPGAETGGRFGLFSRA